LTKRKKIPFREIILIGFLPSFLKKTIYKLRGYQIGKNVSFALGSVIIGKSIKIGDNSSFGFVSVIRGNTVDIGRFVKIGSLSFIDTETFIIGDDSRINENVIVGGITSPESKLEIGKRVIIMEYSFINPTKPIIIGDDSGIGGHCLLFTHGSWLNQMDGFPVTFAPITMGKRVWLPWRVFIMPGVEIGDEVVIGANSLVAKDLPSNVLAAGSPAKILAEDYPKSISKEKQDLIFNKILNDFKEHIKHNGFLVKIEDFDGDKQVNISKKHKSEIFISTRNNEYSFSEKDNLLIIDSNKGIYGDYCMAIDLQRKQRVGTSDVGEEFVKFISRYGVRFDRLD